MNNLGDVILAEKERPPKRTSTVCNVVDRNRRDSVREISILAIPIASHQPPDITCLCAFVFRAADVVLCTILFGASSLSYWLFVSLTVAHQQSTQGRKMVIIIVWFTSFDIVCLVFLMSMFMFGIWWLAGGVKIIIAHCCLGKFVIIVFSYLCAIYNV